MDVGHHNCRDYYLKPEDALPKPREPASTASILAARAAQLSQKSPLNRPSRRPPTFPFLALPLELRHQIYLYLLPCTKEHSDARHSSQTRTNLAPCVLQKSLAKPAATTPSAGKENVVWCRGQITLLAVCRQLHNECAHLLYGENIFVIYVAYDSIAFRFRWLLPSGLTPNRTLEFLKDIPNKYLKLVKRLVVTVDHVDSYTGQIKYNVGGRGLTHGIRSQVVNLIKALKPAPVTQDRGGEEWTDKRRNGQGPRQLTVKLLNGNHHLHAEKRSMINAKGDASVRVIEEGQTVLEPFMELKGLSTLEVTGAVTEAFVKKLMLETMSAR